MITIDFGIGQPNEDDLPLVLVRRSASAALRKDPTCLQYADPLGSPRLRAALSCFLSRQYGYDVPIETLMITNGASHGLDLILRVLAPPDQSVYIEELSYFLGLEMIRGTGRHLTAVPMDAHGIEVSALEAMASQDQPSLLYTIPAFHNPTGITLGTDRRAALSSIADKYNMLVVADEVYHLTNPPQTIPPPMGSYGSSKVLSLGSFSKILGPGLRLGWIEGAPPLLKLLAGDELLQSSGGASPTTSAIVATAIEQGYQDTFLEVIRKRYHAARLHMTAELSKVLPTTVRVQYPDGGYYVWLVLPKGADPDVIAADALAVGVAFHSGERFSVSGRFRNCLRLCFVYYDRETVAVGCQRLGQVLRDHCHD